MAPPRELILQIARLVGADVFAQHFGAPQTAEPDEAALRSVIDERLDVIVRHLVEEAAASDDVIDTTSATAYLDDRLHTLADLVTEEQRMQIRGRFQEATAGW